MSQLQAACNAHNYPMEIFKQFIKELMAPSETCRTKYIE